MVKALVISVQKIITKISLFELLGVLFILLWIYFFASTRSLVNWWIENILVLLFIPWFYRLQYKFSFSNMSLFLIFCFLCIHMYGAQMSYTYNELGLWIQNKYQLVRNPFDRIVHFSFGLFMVYPIQDYLIHRLKTPIKWSYSISILIILALATLFELIEWLVATVSDSETGETYVATQGDVWDAQKDIALALIASIFVMSVLYLHKVKNEKSNFNKACKI